TGTITKKLMTITALTNTKVYDDTISAVGTPTVTGVQVGDTVTGLSEVYDNPSVGTSKTLSVVSYTVNDGNSGNNYTLTTYSNNTTTFTTAKEDAVATYTGSLFVATPTASGTTATVTLSATLQDISASSNPAYDSNAGDIRNATVTFVVDGLGGGSFPAPIGLVSSADTKVGTATLYVGLGLGDHTVTVVVGGYYKNCVGNDANEVVEVAQSGPGKITGGGYLVATSSSSGIMPAAPGTKNNFGFNVQNTKTGLKGTINTIVRNGGRVYQIKGNAMTSLTVNTAISSAHPNPTAVFNGKANIQDITNPLAPISIDGNATLQVTMTDRGEPGKTDSTAITLYNKAGGVWFSSNWTGTTTAEQTLGGGNLVVR